MNVEVENEFRLVSIDQGFRGTPPGQLRRRGQAPVVSEGTAGARLRVLSQVEGTRSESVPSTRQKHAGEPTEREAFLTKPGLMHIEAGGTPEFTVEIRLSL
jgi:hypothetical protein